MLLVKIVENNEIDDYFRTGEVKDMLALPCRVRKEIRIGPHRVRTARNMKKHHLKLFSIILDPALNQEVHLIPKF